MKNVVIIGATSAIAQACARVMAGDGCNFFLFARSLERLDLLARDLKVRGAGEVYSGQFDVTEFATHENLLVEADRKLGGVDTALIAHGTLPDQQQCQVSVDDTIREFTVNASGTISVMTVFANIFEAKGSGTIAVIGSVAGERGRQSNYIYGSAKSAVEVFSQGLRNRLYATGINVLLVKPGFVDTPMTSSFRKGILWVSPDYVAKDIVKAVIKNRTVIYTPWYWRWIMFIIRNIPERIFVRLNL